MAPMIISFAIIVFISIVIGMVARWLRNVQLAEEQRLSEERAARRNRADAGDRSRGGSTGPSSSSDMERFLEEINKLRNRTGGVSAQARPMATPVQPSIPTVEPVRRATPLEETLPSSLPVVTVPDRLPPSSAIPVVLPVGKPLPVAKPLSMTTPKAHGAALGAVVQPERGEKSEFAQALHKLLKSGKGPALAIVLQEVLGPPKCRK